MVSKKAKASNIKRKRKGKWDWLSFGVLEV
jgi:hypothetical protein